MLVPEQALEQAYSLTNRLGLTVTEAEKAEINPELTELLQTQKGLLENLRKRLDVAGVRRPVPSLLARNSILELRGREASR